MSDEDNKQYLTREEYVEALIDNINQLSSELADINAEFNELGPLVPPEADKEPLSERMDDLEDSTQAYMREVSKDVKHHLDCMNEKIWRLHVRMDRLATKCASERTQSPSKRCLEEYLANVLHSNVDLSDDALSRVKDMKHCVENDRCTGCDELGVDDE